jgi:3-hydroxyacyl-CoA dehydrogenase
MAVIGVVGLGAMGLGIAQVYAQAGYSVYATDTQEGARVSALSRLQEALQPRVDAGKLAAETMQAILSAITITNRPEDFAAPDLIIEAIIEDLAIKQALLARLERSFPDAILATNTSALSVTLLSRGMHKPGHLVGLHFFNPAPVMKLVELVTHPKASKAALSRAEDLTTAAGKTVIRCADTPGFIVNRCARPFYGEALAMVAEGRWPSEIDAAMLAAGYLVGLRLGPALPGHVQRQRRRHEGVQIAVQHPLRVRGLMRGAQILHHLIGMQHIGPDLVAPAGIALGLVLGVDRGVALVQFQLIEPRFQRAMALGAVLVLGFIDW